jgi:hypothetical protein
MTKYESWIDQPFWADELPVATRVTMKERTTEDSNGPIIQWELSNDTIKDWALLLGAVIEQVKLAVRDAKIAKELDQHNPSRISIAAAALNKVYNWCYILSRYMNLKERVVQILLTRTSLTHEFRLAQKPENDENTEEDSDMRLMFAETGGEQVLRYLKTVIAWQAAVNSLYDPVQRTLRTPDTLSVGLVEVPQNPTDITPLEDIRREFSVRNSSLSPDDLAERVKLLGAHFNKLCRRRQVLWEFSPTSVTSPNS